MAEQELQKQLVDMVSNVLSSESKEVKDLVLLLLSITMQKSKNIQVEQTAKSVLEDHFKKSIRTGLLAVDDIESLNFEDIGI